METINEVRDQGVKPPLTVADAGDDDAAQFRQDLENRDLTYVIGVNSAHTAFTIDIHRTAPHRPTKAPALDRR
ncbi:transposase [Asanoa siamensis]|uniref:transposase n=1 Tax=Asanoa siamensis TaxID=926357 RepID=UPI001940D22F